MYYKGYYHLFYQYNPMAAVWGNIIWGHAVSTDMVHWLYLEDALERDQWYDRVGVWSGSATIGPDGVPFILYTGIPRACLLLPVALVSSLEEEENSDSRRFGF
jgi:beta-fructofuranosidase